MATATVSAPQQAVDMPALDLRRLVGKLIRSEGVCGVNELKVSQRGAGANMSVDVAAGSAYIADDHAAGGGFYHAVWTAVENVTLTAADPTNPRIDRIVLRVRDSYLGDADNTVSMVALAGTPTAGATLANLSGAQAVPGSSLLLANVLVAAADTAITDSEIDTLLSPGVRQHVVMVGGRSPIWHQELGAAASSFDAQSLPATYRELEIVAVIRSDAAVSSAEGTLRFNNDSAGNYDAQRVSGSGATAAAAETLAGSGAGAILYPGASAAANLAGRVRIVIPEYADTTFEKAALVESGHKQGTATGNLTKRSGVLAWRSTAAITRVQLLPAAGNWVAGSRMTIYAID